jgi:ubiquinone/menaquinone biosynthesis C-methylase UbiE
LFREAADEAAALLGPVERILDVGAGAAPWSLAIAQRNPRCRVTALDLDAVIPTTRGAVAASGSADRFTYLPGDIFTVALPEKAYDLVVLGNVCHLFDAPAILRLLRRLRHALRPGGRIAVIDAIVPDDEETARSVRLYAVGLLTRTSAGAVHSEKSYRDWLATAGYEHVEIRRASQSPPVSLLTGRVVLDESHHHLASWRRTRPAAPTR